MTGPDDAAGDARRIVDGRLDPAPLVRETADPGSGALVVLTTAARQPGAADRETAEGRGAGRSAPGPPATEQAVREMESRTLERFEIRHCRLQLRCDAPPGEAALLAVVRAAHRAAAFDAARWATTSVLDHRGADGDGRPPDTRHERPDAEG